MRGAHARTRAHKHTHEGDTWEQIKSKSMAAAGPGERFHPGFSLWPDTCGRGWRECYYQGDG